MNSIKKPYIIGEAAYNYEGDINYLYRMIDDISEMKLDAIKYHIMLEPESYMQSKHPVLNDIKKWLFDKARWDKILDYSLEKDIDIVALCDDVASIKYILEYTRRKATTKISLEIHAVSLNDHFMLREASFFSGTVILGIGGSSLDEIDYAVSFLKENNINDIILMYGFQSYPTNYADINLSKMNKIRDLFGLQVGYADHTAYNDANNEIISIMAAAMGYDILEKHYTPDEGIERIDYHAAVGKEKLIKIKHLMEMALTVYGSENISMSEPEKSYGNTGPMKKAIVAKTPVKKGEKLTADNLWFKRTVEESPIKQSMFLQLLGLEAIKDIEADEIIDFSKINYSFKKTDPHSLTHIKKD